MKILSRICLFFSLILFSLSVSAQLNPDCANDPARRQALGDYCMIIVSAPFVDGIPGYYPVDAYLEFTAADGGGEIGRVLGYLWVPAEQRYHYYLVTRPTVDNRIYPLSQVAPEAILSSSEDIYGQNN